MKLHKASVRAKFASSCTKLICSGGEVPQLCSHHFTRNKPQKEKRRMQYQQAKIFRIGLNEEL
jgi:hypothetical protein